jgi:hypothetical protein
MIDNDTERLEKLFDLHSRMTAAQRQGRERQGPQSKR